MQTVAPNPIDGAQSLHRNTAPRCESAVQIDRCHLKKRHSPDHPIPCPPHTSGGWTISLRTVRWRCATKPRRSPRMSRRRQKQPADSCMRRLTVSALTTTLGDPASAQSRRRYAALPQNGQSRSAPLVGLRSLYDARHWCRALAGSRPWSWCVLRHPWPRMRPMTPADRGLRALLSASARWSDQTIRLSTTYH